VKPQWRETAEDAVGVIAVALFVCLLTVLVGLSVMALT
jgi:hypothetical protein